MSNVCQLIKSIGPLVVKQSCNSAHLKKWGSFLRLSG